MQAKYRKSNKEALDKTQSFREAHNPIKGDDYSKLVEFYDDM